MIGTLNRRTFLKGLGGAVVAAPFLSSVAERTAHSQSRPAPAKRLIAMFTHYGCVTSRFFPTKSHGPLSAEDLRPTTLRHLAPFVEKLLLPRGIRGMNEWTASAKRGQGNDPHLQVVGSFFTCQPVTPNSDDSFGFPNPRFVPKPIGPSLDHVIAQQLSPSGVPLLLNVGGGTDRPQSAISYSAPETLYPGISAAQALSALTGLFADAAPMSPDTYRAVRGKSIIDLVRDDLDTLQRADMSRADALKLEAWKELIDTTTKVVASSCGAGLAAELGVTQENVAKVRVGLNMDPLTTVITDTMDAADLYSSIAVLATACNANPVIFLKYPANVLFRGLGVTIESHSLSHRIGDASMQGKCLNGVLDMLLTIDDYHARKFARLLELLDSVGELDASAVVWFQEMSDGAAHNLNNLPIVQAGSAGGYFKTGWAVNVEDGTSDLTPGHSEAFCAEPTDEPITLIDQTTGTEPTKANAPINKYFVTLMNALGVKAGEDGFPAVDGAQEVTKFGRYDKTEDFYGGTRNPPIIHSPGEFTALRASS